MLSEIFKVILVVCWGSFILFWTLGWLYNLRKAPPVVQKRPAFQPIWILGIALVVVVIILLRRNAPTSTPFTFTPFTPFIFTALWLQIVGAVILISATAFTLWARWVLGIMWAAITEIKEGHQLRTSGPYHITRHPIYTGLIGMLLGSLFMSGFGIWVPYFIIGLISFIAKATSEERLLKETFGEEYIRYQQSVPRLIPGKQLLTRWR